MQRSPAARLVASIAGCNLRCRLPLWCCEAEAGTACAIRRRLSKQGGGAFMTWAAFPDSAIEVSQGRRAIRQFNSSDAANRTFCPKCGSTIALNYHSQPGTTWLAAGILDGDVGCCPDSHIMLNYKAAWFDLTEHVLHRFPEGG
ncbi:unnamed protein product [Symbiodinium natans]|uniref:CENP-V/GFA domain-containing protein n=1 Tax=Symbiodinium natans TaxID=878477 RepID=A0A812PP07_9DINO|nr:unnamed protein product [Symbiodinium natans]